VQACISGQTSCTVQAVRHLVFIYIRKQGHNSRTGLKRHDLIGLGPGDGLLVIHIFFQPSLWYFIDKLLAAEYWITSSSLRALEDSE
jgi:hypothetical protein